MSTKQIKTTNPICKYKKIQSKSHTETLYTPIQPAHPYWDPLDPHTHHSHPISRPTWSHPQSHTSNTHIWHILDPQILQHLSHRLPLGVTSQRGDPSPTQHVFEEEIEPVDAGQVVSFHTALHWNVVVAFEVMAEIFLHSLCRQNLEVI